jgi:hypothetical protein
MHVGIIDDLIKDLKKLDPFFEPNSKELDETQYSKKSDIMMLRRNYYPKNNRSRSTKRKSRPGEPMIYI